MDDPHLTRFSRRYASAYLSRLRIDSRSLRFGGKDQLLSGQTIRNVWIALSSFFLQDQRELSVPRLTGDAPSLALPGPPQLPDDAFYTPVT